MSDVVARSTARAVLMVVVTSPYPLSQPVIAASVNVSERQTQRALAQLTEANKLKREHREGEGRRNCLYRAADLRIRGTMRTAHAAKTSRARIVALLKDGRARAQPEIRADLKLPARTAKWMLNRLVREGAITRVRLSGLGQRGTVYLLSAASP